MSERSSHAGVAAVLAAGAVELMLALDPSLDPVELDEYIARYFEPEPPKWLGDPHAIVIQLASRDREIEDLRQRLHECAMQAASDDDYVVYDRSRSNQGRIERIDHNQVVVRMRSATWPLGFTETDDVLLVHET